VMGLSAMPALTSAAFVIATCHELALYTYTP
jgi:hypothetical protein